VLALLLSCGKKQEPDPKPTPQPEVQPEIKVPSESQAIFSSGITFQENGGTSAQESTVNFTATQAWSTDVSDVKASSWLRVEPSSGVAGTVNMKVKADANTDEASRTGKVTIKCGTVTKSFTVTQAGNPPATVPVESVTLNKTELTLEPGASETLKATVAPDNATDKTVSWSTSNAEIATVDGGKVTAVKEGEATITANVGEKEATCKVTVKKGVVAVESVTLNKTELALEPGASETLTATVAPDNATEKTVTWSTSNAEVATVEDGKVTAVKEGEATITAKAGEKEATCKVRVKKGVVAVESVTLNKTELELEPGASETLTAAVAPDNATDKTVTWITSNAEVATVEDGKVTAVKDGSAVITAMAGGKSAYCTVTVKEYVFEVTPKKVELSAGGGTFDITVNTTHEYHLNSKPDWVTEVSVTGYVHTFKVDVNPSTEARSGVVVFCDDKGTCLPCSVVQDGFGPFTISPTSVELESEGGTFEVTVSCSTTYHIQSKPEWVKEITPANNGKVHVFQVDALSSEEARSGVIVFCDDQGTCIPCNVKQKGHVPDTSGGGTEDVPDGNPVKW
jgi:uncharacterized protein YjdB